MPLIQCDRNKAQQYRHEYYLRNKEKVSQQGKDWRKNNHDRYKQMSKESYHRRKSDPKNIISFLLKHAKARAIQKGIEFNLIGEDIYLPDICPILKIPFDKNSRRYSYSLDRINPNKGYTKDNIWVISQIANAMKWDSTHEERILFAKWVLSLEGGYSLAINSM